MSYGYGNDPYNNPQAFGLEIIGTLDDPEACYSFDYLIVWKHTDGRVFYAQDSGCSCPSPFEDFGSLDDLTEVTDTTWAEFQSDVEQHCAPREYDYEKGEYVTSSVADPNAADKTQVLAKVAALLREQKTPEREASLVGFVVLIENGKPRIAKTYYAEAE